jgi:subtilisin family serine protease
VTAKEAGGSQSMIFQDKRERRAISPYHFLKLFCWALTALPLLFPRALHSQVADDQTLVPAGLKSVANPAPVSRNFEKIQSQHKVLIGVIDSGIDYNHPRLQPNIHFHLDEQGQPIGFGYDFVGDDTWASPVLIRTDPFNPMIDDKEKKKLKATQKEVQKLDEFFPELKRFYHPHRDLILESIVGAYHGTHVAGLASYDRPEIGLIGYRVVPLNRNAAKGHSYEKALIENLISAIHQAAADGVRIISMSIKDSYVQRNESRISDPDDQSGGNENKSAFVNRMAQLEQLEYAIAQYPNILFVAATGNNAGWSDQDSRYQYPCGLELDNLLCVGAVNESGRLTHFTNIPLNNAHLVFALGHQVISTIPAKNCVWEGLRSHSSSLSLAAKRRQSNPELADILLMLFAQKLNEHCGEAKRLAPLSGTSMSTPLVSRIAADFLIEEPELSALDAIRKIYQKAYKESVGQGLVLRKLKVRKPSWYQRNELAQLFSHPRWGVQEDLILKETEKMYWEAAFQKDPKSDP